MVKTFVPPGETNKLGIMVSAFKIKIYCEDMEMSILGLNGFCFIRESSLSIIVQSPCFCFVPAVGSHQVVRISLVVALLLSELCFNVACC